MEEILAMIKEQADKALEYAKKFGKTTVDKTNTVVSQTKLKMAIGKTEDKIKTVYSDIGEKIYASYTDKTSAPDVEELCEKLDSLHKEVEDLEQQLNEISETKKCDKCGAYNRSENVYCAHCGEKLSVETEEADETVEPVVSED